MVTQTDGSVAVATINRTKHKSAIDQHQFLRKIKQNRHQNKAVSVSKTRHQNLKLGFQTSMSEEHPASPVKLEGNDEEKNTTVPDKIKLIPYRQMKSINESEKSGGEPDGRALFMNDSDDSGRQVDSRASLQVTNSKLYRYVTGVGAH